MPDTTPEARNHHAVDTGGDGLQQALAVTLARIRALCPPASGARDCACRNDRRVDCTRLGIEELGETLFTGFRHFTTEERQMRGLSGQEMDADHRDRHVAAHADFMERLSRLADRWDSDNPKPCLAELARLIDTWLTGHVPDFDLVLRQALARQQEPPAAR